MENLAKKVLIIGGSGFIGYNLSKYLIYNRKYNITIADNQFRGKKDSDIEKLLMNSNVKFIDADQKKHLQRVRHTDLFRQKKRSNKDPIKEFRFYNYIKLNCACQIVFCKVLVLMLCFNNSMACGVININIDRYLMFVYDHLR